MATGIVSAKGWVAIPQELRKRYGLTKGSKVQFVEEEGVISLVPIPADPIAGLRGMLKDGPSLTEGLLEDRRREREKEEAEIRADAARKR